MKNVPEIFGSLVFNDATMEKRLPPAIYQSLKRTMREGKHLDLAVANVVATAMKDWAIENGATHFTHWFQPMTGITAEKHDSFITPTDDGGVIMEFSGKELVKGESDASSFPSGGLRATFEARGYTAWDPTAYAFIKDGVLCIPTAFCSWGGEALDKKTPLLRSMETINRETLRILSLFDRFSGDENRTPVSTVNTTVGPEQEYFLVDEEMFDRRKDLLYTGRTLFGAMAPKGQELNDHYFGSIKSRVIAYMKDLDEELWKLGVLAKTEHNEAAPAQHELAPIYSTTNIATDQNQITMDLMKKVAKRHGLVCLLHEKPFEGVNGSGKHNNWSLTTNTGVNLLEPGATPHENAQFLLFLCAVLAAVDDYQDLLRISIASPGNDHRLGASEAPPAIVSVFLGDELTGILDAIESDRVYDAREKVQMKVGVHVLPRFPKDATDRNRTSPFAFTGNKFEFRMLGASASVADANVVLNTAVADVLRTFADRLEGATPETFNFMLHDLIRETYRAHRRIVFNGNGYGEEWAKEAAARGLYNLRTTPDALPYLLAEKNVALFERHRVLSATELRSRYEIMLENYGKVLNIEARTMSDMTRKDFLPAISACVHDLCDCVNAKKTAAPGASRVYEERTVTSLSQAESDIYRLVSALEGARAEAVAQTDALTRACRFRDNVLPLMEDLRRVVDRAEGEVGSDYWPIPTYGDLLYGVR